MQMTQSNKMNRSILIGSLGFRNQIQMAAGRMHEDIHESSYVPASRFHVWMRNNAT